MSKRLIYLICFVPALCLVVDVQAADVAWTDATGNHLWSTPANWDTGTVPTSADTVKIRISPGPTVTNQDAVANVVQPAAGSNNTGDLTVDGGTLTIANRLVMAQSNGSNGTLNMISGTITVGGRFAVGRYGSGTLNMTGGTITLEGPLQLPEMSTGTAHANLHGGIITAGNLEMRVAGGVGTIDIGAGTLIIIGDSLSAVQGYIDNGWITAYDGNGTLQLDYNVTNPGNTTLKAFFLELTTASNPIPAFPATDVPRDMTLSWKPGIYADKHDVYFGTNFDDVNNADRTNPLGVLVSQDQDLNSYSPTQVLQWEQTYYWRIDEVNAPPDYTIYKGDVWQFTVEPFAYPIAGENIIATASSSATDRASENTLNGSGLDDSGLLHGKDAENAMWLSDPAGPQPTWIEFQFDKIYKLHELWVWNSNDSLEPVLGLGLKDVSIEYSVNGTDYTTLDTTHEFARAPGTPDYEHNTTIDFSGAAAKYVRLTANSNWGGILNQYGLSEVRFFHIPVYAKEPSPDSGATDVNVDVVLSFKAGREAAKHNVYLSTDQQAVVDGTAPVSALTETSYGPLSLDLGKTYYWRVDEVNEAEAPATWQGDLWDFKAQEYFVVDDFESYNDLDPTDPASNRIFLTWIDGYGIATNGSVVGYENFPFAERTIVHSGKQSMPLSYSNTGGAAYSEAERTFAVGQNWTQAGAATLVLYFHGSEGNTGQLYVKVDGSKVVYDGDAADMAKVEWKQWNIDLASLGANLQNVTKLAIGIDGNGAGGTLYVDDIRLYRLAP
ncbi:MAG: discoidin domain-containing protein [Planctomycetota bacterium]|jgi:hypothetical protein